MAVYHNRRVATCLNTVVLQHHLRYATPKFAHYAVLLRKGNMVSRVHTNRAVPLQHRSIHAEAQLVKATWEHSRHSKLKHSVDVLVVRVSKQGVLMKSKPCSDCLRILRRAEHLPVRNIIYSVGETTLWAEPVKTMTSTHVTYGFRQMAYNRASCAGGF